MTARDPAVSYDQSLAQTFRFVGQQLLKQVHTAIPAEVLEYFPDRQQAHLQPVVGLRLGDERIVRRSPLLNVPVLWPGSSGWIVHAALQPGDPVLPVFQPNGRRPIQVLDTDPRRRNSQAFYSRTHQQNRQPVLLRQHPAACNTDHTIRCVSLNLAGCLV